MRITGVDLVAVDGLSASLARTIISEVGTDMSRVPTEKHFCSWLGLTSHHEISGGKILRNHTLKTDNRAGQAFRQAAACVVRSQSAFGAFYRRKKTQLGPMQALAATAHKIARTCLSSAQIQDRVSRPGRGTIRTTISRTGTGSLAQTSSQTRVPPDRRLSRGTLLTHRLAHAGHFALSVAGTYRLS